MPKSKELFLVSYLPTTDDVEKILQEKLKQVDMYAVILHDKDVYLEDTIDKDTGKILHAKGEKKDNHIHIYLKLFESREVNEVRRWFEKTIDGVRINCLSKIVRDRVGVIKYLTHATKRSANKYQYPETDVKAFNLNLDDREEPIDYMTDLIRDVLNGMTKYKLVYKYGAKLVNHWPSICDFVKSIDYEELETFIGDPFSGLTTTYTSQNDDFVEQIKTQI